MPIQFDLFHDILNWCRMLWIRDTKGFLLLLFWSAWMVENRLQKMSVCENLLSAIHLQASSIAISSAWNTEQLLCCLNVQVVMKKLLLELYLWKLLAPTEPSDNRAFSKSRILRLTGISSANATAAVVETVRKPLIISIAKLRNIQLFTSIIQLNTISKFYQITW